MEITKQNRKSPNEIVNRLRLAGESNSLLGMVMKKFSTRMRNRDVLTPGALKLAMSKDDHNYPKQRYAEILKLLASVGLGKLELGPRGQVRALNRIPLDLKIIGQMYLREDMTGLEKAINSPVEEIEFKKSPPNSVTLSIMIEGKKVDFPGLKDLDQEALGEFIVKFFELCRKFTE